MSTKTIYKRIALVAVAALGAGVLSVAPANATAGTIDVTGAVAGTGDTPAALATATGITGNQVIFTYTENVTVNDAKLYVNTTGGTIVSASATNGSIAATGTTIATGGTWTPNNSAVSVGTFAVTSAVAGTQVIGFQTLDAGTGVYSTVAALTITWVAATSTDLGSVNAYVLANNDTCNASTAASTAGAVDYTGAGNGVDLCVVLKNASGLGYTRSTAVSVIGNGIAKVDGNAVAVEGTVTAGFQKFDILGNKLSGKGTFTVSATSTNADGATVTTKSTTASVIANGDFTSITLANVKASIAASAQTVAIDYSAKDKDGQAATTVGSGTTTWYVESDKGTAAITATAPDNASASIGTVVDDAIDALGDSNDAGRVTVNAGSAYEKLTIWVTKKNAAGATITSNKVTVFVSTDSAKTVTVTAAKVATGGYTVTVTALSDAATTGTAYPVIDGETVTLGASAGILSATSLATGKTGNAQFTYYEPQLSGTVLMTAGADLAVGTASLVVANGALDGITTLVNSLIAKINALNKLVVKIQRKVRA